MTGVVGGPSAIPNGWRRLRWAELADRWEVPLDVAEVNPLNAFRPGLSTGSWPSSIRPPTEGSLDWETYERMMAILRAFTGSSPILVYSTILAWYGDTGFEVPLVTATMDELLASYTTAPISGSGQNWWPIDREWLVYTDYDLCSTVVHGDEDLISEVVADDFLEASLPDWMKVAPDQTLRVAEPTVSMGNSAEFASPLGIRWSGCRWPSRVGPVRIVIDLDLDSQGVGSVTNRPWQRRRTLRRARREAEEVRVDPT